MEAATGEYKLYSCLLFFFFFLVIVKSKLDESGLNTCEFFADLGM